MSLLLHILVYFHYRTINLWKTTATECVYVEVCTHLNKLRGWESFPPYKRFFPWVSTITLKCCYSINNTKKGMKRTFSWIWAVPISSLSCFPVDAVTAISFINLRSPLTPLTSVIFVIFSLTVSAGSKSLMEKWKKLCYYIPAHHNIIFT